MRDGIKISQFDNPVGKEPQCPSDMSLRRVGTGKHGYSCLNVTRDLGHCSRTRFIIAGGGYPAKSKLFSDPSNSTGRGHNSLRDLAVFALLAEAPVRE
ncbi:MAG: hypothetical protein M1133_14755 [Armatimonadetes bacterium]|nr:hypothetical protein [Armatimonadota bacterium]